MHHQPFSALALLTALIASTGAMAQNSNPPASQNKQPPGVNAPQQPTSSAQNPQNQASANNEAAQQIQPSSLKKDQVRNIQKALDKAGFNVKHVDGIWGQETADALKEFQKSKNLPSSGDLDSKTMAALGVDVGSDQTGSIKHGASNSSQNKAPQSH